MGWGKKVWQWSGLTDVRMDWGRKERKMFDTDKKFWKLQLFSEGEGEGGEGAASTGEGDGGGPDEGNQGGEGNEPLSFNDFLKLEGNQAEFDRRVDKAIETAIKKAREQWDLETNTKLSEAEKLARMTKEQKAEYKAQQMEKELNKLKAEKARTELAATARKMLSDENIAVPDSLLTYIVGGDAEKTKAAVEDFVKLFNGAVSEEVKKSARQTTPKEGGSTAGGESKKMDIAKMAKEARIIK
ncbi:DUF4355 domain-containing protein [Dialister hominis]|uniref:DUF4355 domain-containing protein n=1 Tax=Dialister hominis TaxID=2582419 RepID=UPI003AB3867D